MGAGPWPRVQAGAFSRPVGGRAGCRRPRGKAWGKGSCCFGDYAFILDSFRVVSREAEPLTAKGAGGSPDLEAKLSFL